VLDQRHGEIEVVGVHDDPDEPEPIIGAAAP
jgi:hypothetical protein